MSQEQSKLPIENYIAKELVHYSGQTFSNSKEAFQWLEEAFYRIAEQSHEVGKEEGHQEKFRVGIARLEGEYEQKIRTATLKECIEIGEKMKLQKISDFEDAYNQAITNYQQQLEKLK